MITRRNLDTWDLGLVTPGLCALLSWQVSRVTRDIEKLEATNEPGLAIVTAAHCTLITLTNDNDDDVGVPGPRVSLVTSHFLMWGSWSRAGSGQ